MENQIKSLCPLAKQVRIKKFYDGSKYITVEALESKDYPGNIIDNGKYLIFYLDGDILTFENSGSVWLSAEDKQTEKYKYFAMRNISSLVGKKFRKCKVKSEEDVIKKIADYTNKVFEAMDKYTGGYPYNTK